MILDLVRESSKTWREITRLARPIDSSKPVIIGSNPKARSNFEAYTDNEKIYINVNDEGKFQQDLENTVVSAYRIAASRVYDISRPISDVELLRNLVFDLFLFIHFHEQMHPWLCPNSKSDEKKINASLYEGICEAEPGIIKSEAMFKVNNCKNLIWDLVLNTSFISKVAGHGDILEEKVNFVFKKEEREINGEPIIHYPSGILPVIYMVSAHNHTTDVPIGLTGCFYTSLSYNDPRLRQNAMKVFVNNLALKKMHDAEQVLSAMYLGLVTELDPVSLMKRGIDDQEFKDRVKRVTDLSNPGYEENQGYFVETITRIFDTPSLRYDALKGFVKAISKYVSLTQKQGSPDPNTSGSNGSGQSRNGDDKNNNEGDGNKSNDGTGGNGKTQEEMDEDSLNSTLDDLLDELNGKEVDDLLEDAANAGGRGAGKPSPKQIQKIRIRAIDEHYKIKSETLEIRNPKEERESVDMGTRKKWILVSSNTITAPQAAMLNQQQIMAFQRMTGLPILVNLGGGYYKINHYETKETPLKSYTTVSTGVEIPDNWIFIQDSSSSMGGHNYVGTGSKFDVLNLVKYGLMKGMYDTARLLGKDPQFGVVDFSDRTKYRGLDSLIKIYDAKSHPIKTISLTPQVGGTDIDTKIFRRIEQELAPGKTLWTMVTDGDISGCGNQPQNSALFSEIDRLSSQPNNSFVFVEVDYNSELGKVVSALANTRDSLDYFPVKNVLEIQDKLGTLLIKYK